MMGQAVAAAAVAVRSQETERFLPGHDHRAVHDRIARQSDSTLNVVQLFDATCPTGTQDDGAGWPTRTDDRGQEEAAVVDAVGPDAGFLIETGRRNWPDDHGQ
jgi:hypothetical protein